MILSLIQNLKQSEHILSGAYHLSRQLGKPFAVGALAGTDITNSDLNGLIEKYQIQADKILENTVEYEDIAEICETEEISFLFLPLTQLKNKAISRLLKSCRDLRIPYLLYRKEYGKLDLKHVIVPVNFLEEEIEKAQFAAAFGRFSGSQILLLQANDYGSKAAITVARMKELFDKFTFPYQIVQAAGDSFKVDKEAVQKAGQDDLGLILISASREYGLDDIIFGPKELHLIRKSTKPVLLINPRGDLYALCD